MKGTCDCNKAPSLARQRCLPGQRATTGRWSGCSALEEVRERAIPVRPPAQRPGPRRASGQPAPGPCRPPQPPGPARAARASCPRAAPPAPLRCAASALHRSSQTASGVARRVTPAARHHATERACVGRLRPGSALGAGERLGRPAARRAVVQGLPDVRVSARVAGRLRLLPACRLRRPGLWPWYSVLCRLTGADQCAHTRATHRHDREVRAPRAIGQVGGR